MEYQEKISFVRGNVSVNKRYSIKKNVIKVDEMKDIIILTDFCGPMDGKFNSRFLYLADMLCTENEVELITSNFNHGTKTYITWKLQQTEYPITMLHERSYKKNISLRRFISHYTWAKSVKKYLKNRKKPDVIYCAIPTLYASYEAAKYCKKNDIRFVIDIQDLWPEAFQMVVNIPMISTLIFAPFTIIANSIYKMADAICAVSDTYIKRALCVNKKCISGTTVYLGTDLDIFDKNAKGSPILEKKDREIWLAYCGTLGSSYNLIVIFDALKILKARGLQLKFVIMGDGSRRDEFEEKSKGLDVVFTGLLPYEQMCSLLSICDITVNPIAHRAAQSIINKHADYLASGLPIVSTQENEEFRKLIDDYHMGFNCNNDDAKEVADKIELLCKDQELRIKMGEMQEGVLKSVLIGKLHILN